MTFAEQEVKTPEEWVNALIFQIELESELNKQEVIKCKSKEL